MAKRRSPANERGMKMMRQDFEDMGVVNDLGPRVFETEDPVGKAKARMRADYPDQNPAYVPLPRWLMTLLKDENTAAMAGLGSVFYSKPDSTMGQQTFEDIMAHELRHLKGDQDESGDLHSWDMPREQSSYLEEQRRREKRGWDRLPAHLEARKP